MTQFEIDSDTRALLDRYGFDEAQLEGLRERFIRGELGVETNRVQGRVEPPAASDLTRLPAPDSVERKRLAARGIEAMRAGQVGSLGLKPRLLSPGRAASASTCASVSVVAIGRARSACRSTGAPS